MNLKQYNLCVQTEICLIFFLTVYCGHKIRFAAAAFVAAVMRITRVSICEKVWRPLAHVGFTGE